MKTQDKLMTISVREANMGSKDSIEKYVKDECEKYGITKIEIVQLDHEEGKSVYQIIKKYLKYSASDINAHGYCDFVAVGNAGLNFSSYNTKRLGSVANAVLRARLMNCLLVM
jgi:ABC-type branched-subunit amino acid transport system substrate-binding protein